MFYIFTAGSKEGNIDTVNAILQQDFVIQMKIMPNDIFSFCCAPLFDTSVFLSVGWHLLVENQFGK